MRPLAHASNATACAFARFALSRSTEKNDWAFFWDDEAAGFVPPLTAAHVHRVWRAAVESPEARATGVVILATCSSTPPQPTLSRVLLPATGAAPAFTIHRACSACVLALGLRRDAARSVFESSIAISSGGSAPDTRTLGELTLVPCTRAGGWPLVAVERFCDYAPSATIMERRDSSSLPLLPPSRLRVASSCVATSVPLSARTHHGGGRWRAWTFTTSFTRGTP